MPTIHGDHLSITYGQAPYIVVQFEGVISQDHYKAGLDDQRIYDLIRRKGKHTLLIDMTSTQFDTAAVDWTLGPWLSKVSRLGLKRLAIVINDAVYEMMRNLLPGWEEQGDSKTTLVKFFYTSQFYEGSSAISWLESR